LSKNNSETLKKFARPPLVETVLGVQFQPLPGFSNAHLGVFWKRLGQEWPSLSDAPSLEPQFERFAGTEAWAKWGVQLKLTQDVGSRLQITSASQDRMIQVQNGRFHYNWLGQSGARYPHYNELRRAFVHELSNFQKFLAEELQAELQPNQWEVTYVNHLPKETVWKRLDDSADVFRKGASLSAGIQGLPLVDLAGEWHYEIPPQQGRLHVELKHGRLASADAPELLILTLTARGPIGDREEEGLDLDKGLDLGHKVIVQAFSELTTEAAHSFWGVINDAD
jgi:uncharacterized protein (TIGR04255 family)